VNAAPVGDAQFREALFGGGGKSGVGRDVVVQVFASAFSLPLFR